MNELRDLKRARDHIYYYCLSEDLATDDFRAALAALFENAISNCESLGRMGADMGLEIYAEEEAASLIWEKHVALARAYLAKQESEHPLWRDTPRPLTDEESKRWHETRSRKDE